MYTPSIAVNARSLTTPGGGAGRGAAPGAPAAPAEKKLGRKAETWSFGYSADSRKTTSPRRAMPPQDICAHIRAYAPVRRALSEGTRMGARYLAAR